MFFRKLQNMIIINAFKIKKTETVRSWFLYFFVIFDVPGRFHVDLMSQCYLYYVFLRQHLRNSPWFYYFALNKLWASNVKICSVGCDSKIQLFVWWTGILEKKSFTYLGNIFNFEWYTISYITILSSGVYYN